MTEKIVKWLVLLLLFNITMAIAFSLFLPVKSAQLPAQNNFRPDEKTAKVQNHPATSPDLQISGLDTKPIAVSQPVKLLPESGDKILASATNENQALDALRDWARKNPESALLWGQQQTNDAERNEALTDACFQIAQADPQRAVMLAEKFGLDNGAVLNNLAQQWAAADLTTALNWIATQPAGDQRDALVTGMAFVWSQTEPADAAKFVAEQILPGSTQDEAAMMVLHQWALVDPTAASAWAQQFSDPLRSRALSEISGITEYKRAIAQSK